MLQTLEQIQNSIKHTITPLCPIFGQCGGCQYQDIPYREELRIKEEYLQHTLLKSTTIPLSLFEPIEASPKEYYYRNRLDLKIIRTKNKQIQMGFSPESGKRLIPSNTCFIARKEISDFLPELLQQASEKLTNKYRQANLVIRTGDDGRIFWGGIGRRSLELGEEDYLWTEIKGRKIFYSLDTFFQANLSILPKLFKRLEEFKTTFKSNRFEPCSYLINLRNQNRGFYP